MKYTLPTNREGSSQVEAPKGQNFGTLKLKLNIEVAGKIK